MAMPSSKAFPVAAAGPVLGPTTPILIVSWAQAREPRAKSRMTVKPNVLFIFAPPCFDDSNLQGQTFCVIPIFFSLAGARGIAHPQSE